MSNDHIYVVIVPQADLAAQALATTRVALGKHAAKHEPASPRVATGTPASTRAPTGKPAPTRGAARMRPSTKTVSASSAPRRAGSGYVGGTDHQLRTWSVVVGDDKYDVHDSGAACGYRIECNGSTVWTGTMGRRGSYHTLTTTLAKGTQEEVLRLVYVGDRRHAQARTPARAHAAPPSGPRAAKRKALASHPTPAPPPSTTRTREVKAKPASPDSQPRSAPPPHVEPKAKQRAKPTTRHAPAAPASASGVKAKEKAKAKPRAKPQATSESTHAGPLTQRTPVSQPSAKPSSRRTAPRVDDTAVLNEIKKNLHEGDPATAEKHFQVMKAIWLRGGREAAIAWKAQHKLASVVDAFDDWMEKNVEAARAMLGASPRSAPKHEHVA